MQHPKSKVEVEGVKLSVGAVRVTEVEGGLARRGKFTVAESDARAEAARLEADAAARAARSRGAAGDDAPAAPLTVELMADRYTRSPSGLLWCLVHGCSFGPGAVGAYCPGCVREEGSALAREAREKFDSSPGEEKNLRASAGDSVTSSVSASSIMPTGQSATTAPGDADSNLPPPTSPRCSEAALLLAIAANLAERATLYARAGDRAELKGHAERIARFAEQLPADPFAIGEGVPRG